MSVTSFKEIHDGREGGDTLANLTGSRKHTRVFRAITNSNYDTDVDVLLCSLCPQPGQVFPQDRWSYVQDRKAVNDKKSKRVWIVTIQYGTFTGTKRSANPFNDETVITWKTDTTQQPFYFDANDDPILNSAGDFFLEPIKDEVSEWVVSIKKNLPGVPSWILDYRNAVNSDDIEIDGISIPAGSAKIKAIGIGSWQLRSRYRYRELTLEIKIQDSWKKYIQDQGIFQLITIHPFTGDDYDLHIPCVDDHGKPVTHPVLLDGDGKQLPTGTDPTTVDPLEFDLRVTKPFASLPLN